MLASNARPEATVDSALRRRVRAHRHRDIRNRERKVNLRWSARWVSGGLLIMILLLLLQFGIASSNYMNVISVEGVSYFTSEELLGLLGVSRSNIFWLDPAAVSARLLRQPGIASVAVRLGWPAGALQIRITEKEPIFAWQVEEQTYWVAAEGSIMPRYHLNRDLPIIHARDSGEMEYTFDSELTPSLVTQVRALLQQLPSADRLMYDPNPTRGLGYWRGADTVVWFGHGGDFAQKQQLVQKIADSAWENGLQLAEINVAHPDAYHFRILAVE